MTDLHNKYRPADFDQVLGQDHVIKSLQEFEKAQNWPHAFLFSGPSGAGKTTLSRILATKLGTHPSAIMELDAATFNGVDTIRALTSDLQYTSFGESSIKFIILDEFHMMSKSSFNALLKTIEEPPKHVYFAFCTTEPDKIPETIKTRCHQYHLKDVSYDNLFDLVSAIADIEAINLSEKCLQIIAQESMGSPRRALVYLSKARHCTSVQEVREVLESAEEDVDVIELCRLLAGRTQATWKTAIGVVTRLDMKNPESIRLTIVNYTAKALLNTKATNDAQKLLAILDAFSKPCNPSEKMAGILLPLGLLLLAEPS